jgi:carboxypeptidase C (cathepsin A)
MLPVTLLSGLVAFSASGAARKLSLQERQIPKDPEGVMTITSPQGASIRFKQPGKQGVCETAEGVDDYAGYISLNEKTNMFFWFFEARENPTEKPVSHFWNCWKG